MKTLIGSEKQILWAVSIRETLIQKINNRIASFESDIISDPELTEVWQSEIEENKERLNYLHECEHASDIIDLRDTGMFFDPNHERKIHTK